MPAPAKPVLELLKTGNFNRTRHWDRLPKAAKAAYVRAGGGTRGRAAALAAIEHLDEMDRWDELVAMRDSAAAWANEAGIELMTTQPDKFDAQQDEVLYRRRVASAVQDELVALSERLELERPPVYASRPPDDPDAVRQHVLDFACTSQ